MYKAYYGLECNPFDKSINEKNPFKSEDYKQAMSRLEHLKKIKGIGLFTGLSGMGKTHALRSFKATLNPSLYKVVYIPLSTVTVLEFYKGLAYGLGLEPSFRKVDMYKQIQESISTLSKEKKITPVIMIDEAQYLKTEILNDFKILLNFDMDRENYAILVLTGQPLLINTMNKQIHEALKQRIVISYQFTGISREEVDDYIKTRLKLGGVKENIFSESSIEAIYSCSNGSVRKLNNLLEKCLMIGCQADKREIDAEIVMNAQNEIELL